VIREVNERIAQLYQGEPSATAVELLCECENEQCAERILLTVAEYDDIRTRDGRYAVARAHAAASGRRLVGEGQGFAMVESSGDGADAPR
jgi:hypothetical protein